MDRPTPVDIRPFLDQIEDGDPIGAAYRLAQALGPDAPGQAFYEAGSIALDRRDELGEDALRFARIVFGEAVERAPDLGEAHHDLATTMRELGMAEDAIAHYRRALEIMPGDPDSMIGLGAALADAGQKDGAIEALTLATERFPDNGRAHAHLGIALELAGRDLEAAAAYARAVARFDAALVRATEDEIADDDREVAEAAMRRRWAMIQHAELLERLGRFPQAIVQFRRLHEEERAIAEAEDEEEAEEDELDASALASTQEPAGDVVAPLADGGAGETLLDAGAPDPDTGDDDDDVAHAALERAIEEAVASVDGSERADGDDDDDDGEAEDDEAVDEVAPEQEAGRRGLERIFVRLLALGRTDLAFLVLDELGGEIADEASRATYAIYDGDDGLPTIMIERWDDGERTRLDPHAAAPSRGEPAGDGEV